MHKITALYKFCDIKDPVQLQRKLKKELNTDIKNQKNNNQKAILFILGSAISARWKHKGISKFHKPPMLNGITKKKIMYMACTVTTCRYIVPDNMKE